MKFPDVLRPDASGLAFVGGDLAVETVCEAYVRRGLFPWCGGPRIPWFWPDPRAILIPSRFRVTRSLAKRARTAGLRVAFDRDFAGAMLRCATTVRTGEYNTWITPDMRDAYAELHRLGIAHSVEVYRDGTPVGGLYGLTFGRFFHGESMYHHERDTSKLALWAMCQALDARAFELVDCQVMTPHLASLGAEDVPRPVYMARLAANAARPSLHASWAAWQVPCLPPLE
ncbi:MAG: leucyl/phenylalanyl-tRNA--protein transferase [Deltaproteobacteria bacterium]|nr:leucyl/phenylalanyl-tRNA--protein transferase [Deltaproteobacteria bacterium]MCW5807977.1 leucyl/phenylalanyl-tRNA--protein transferase [Deltaproteobacteria bacterium]